MKKKFALVSLLILITIILFAFCYDKEKICGVKTIRQDEWDEITEARLCKALDVTLFFDRVEMPFDNEKQMYFISQSMYCDEWQGNISVDGDVDLCFLLPEQKKQSLICMGDVLSLLVYTEDAYEIKYIAVSGFAIVALDENYTEDSLSYGSMRFFSVGSSEQDARIDVGEFLCKYHVRGGFSASNPKKSYKLNLLKEDGTARKKSFLGMRDDNDWILNPLFFDQSKMREKIAYNLWNQISDTCHMQLEYVEVIINGDYRGVYCLQEPVDLKTFQAADQSFLYSTKYWDYNQNDAELYEWNEISGKSVINEYSIDKYKDPDLALELLKALNSVIKGIPYDSEYKIVFDGDSYINHLLMINMLLAVDNDYKNQKLLLQQTGEKEYTVYKMIWDLDWTFLNENVVESQRPIDEIMVDRAYVNRGEDSGLHEKIRKKYWECRSEFYNEEYIFALIDQYHDQLVNSGAILREREKWPDTEFELNCTYLKNFVPARIFCLDQYYG